ncbi:MAG: hypothetical protein DRH26_01625 [Deltaproteobacteria bacterium]|nr:MAG: hypothetical protein DRH26_01625 [Deltaproteobacteria bacterium]
MPKIEKPFPSVLDFLTTRFPFIYRKIWEAGIGREKQDSQGRPVVQDENCTGYSAIFEYQVCK